MRPWQTWTSGHVCSRVEGKREQQDRRKHSHGVPSKAGPRSIGGEGTTWCGGEDEVEKFFLLTTCEICEISS